MNLILKFPLKGTIRNFIIQLDFDTRGIFAQPCASERVFPARFRLSNGLWLGGGRCKSQADDHGDWSPARRQEGGVRWRLFCSNFGPRAVAYESRLWCRLPGAHDDTLIMGLTCQKQSI